MGSSKPLCPHERTPFIKATEVVMGRITYEASAWCHKCGSLEVTKNDNLKWKMPNLIRKTSQKLVKND